MGGGSSNLKLQLNFHQNLYQTTLLRCAVGLTSFWACFPLNLNCCTALCPAGPPELGLAQMNSCVLIKRQYFQFEIYKCSCSITFFVPTKLVFAFEVQNLKLSCIQGQINSDPKWSNLDYRCQFLQQHIRMHTEILLHLNWKSKSIENQTLDKSDGINGANLTFNKINYWLNQEHFVFISV